MSMGLDCYKSVKITKLFIKLCNILNYIYNILNYIYKVISNVYFLHATIRNYTNHDDKLPGTSCYQLKL